MSISPLHARIKFMECILNISHKLDLKKWRVSGKRGSKMMKDKETVVRAAFNKTLGLAPNSVKQGFGNTSDGNMSRRFFANYRISSEITGIDEELIRRFKTILNTINCTDLMDVGKFEEFCKETARLSVDLYGWSYMLNSVHKVLTHGAQILREASCRLAC